MKKQTKQEIVGNYKDKCDCSDDDKCGCTFPNNTKLNYDASASSPTADFSSTAEKTKSE